MIAATLWAAYPACAVAAVDVAPPSEPVVDPAPCLSAVSAGNDDAVIAACAALIGYAKAAAADRLKALAARAAAYARKDQPDRAIVDYDAALKLDPARGDLFNARGELWRLKGDRPRAIRDFAAAIRLDPRNETARANHKALALEIERQGAAMAIKDQPKPPLK
jgi:tetratricopeptide (TPR) repeat protein